ncbi:hypothetical protein GF380_05890 [Candidatus Uhrbacteria bacterium]|nr:hypothetical protein [Candidatus Uhrbacteria bacterium]MBD3284522.1 hypothetical protein [Candidatus Uhrbacteria bacterium]
MAIRTQKRRPREPFPAPPTPGIYKKIAYSFVALTIIIVFAALWFSSVRATVTVTVTREPTDVKTEVVVADTPAQGELAGRVVQGVFEKVMEHDATHGSGRSVLGTSTGKVRIFNNRSSDQPLVATTRLLTADERLYRIVEGVTVPAKGFVEVEAYSDEEGAKFDFSKKATFTIPGLSDVMQEYVYAESVTPFTGGEEIVRFVTNEDIQTAYDELEAAVLKEAKESLNAEAQDARFSDSTYIVEILEKNTSVSVGDEAESFLSSMKVTVTGVYYSKMDMEALVREGVKERVPEGREIVAQGPIKMTFSVKDINVASEEAELEVNAEVLTKATSADTLVAKDRITGLSIDEAEDKVEQMSGVEQASIHVRPNWVRRLPTLQDHIALKVK